MSSQPLDGIVVVSVEQAVAAPLATRLLADLGARVIKIERPDGGDFARGYDHSVKGLASHFVWLNRSKESVVLDLTRTAGKQILWSLIDRSDVFVQNLGPGACERLGFGSDALRARKPDLVVANVSGYGSSGPLRSRRAYDMLVQAESGLFAVTGTPETPVKVGIPIADIAAAMYTANAVLAALVRKGGNGSGASIDVSMLDALVDWMQYPLYLAAYGQSPVPRTTVAHTGIVPYDSYPTADGAVLISVQNDRQWRALAEALGRPDLRDDPALATNPQRCAQRSRVDAEIAVSTRALASTQLVDLLEEARIPVAQVRELAEVVSHPQLRERGRWAQVDTEAGSIRAILPPAIFTDTNPELGPVPALGASTQAVLEELHYSARQIADLRAEGTVG